MVNTKGSVYLGESPAPHPASRFAPSQLLLRAQTSASPTVSPGGAPDAAAMTGGKFSAGLTGCVRNLVLMNARPGRQPAPTVDLQAFAAHGINVQPCSS